MTAPFYADDTVTVHHGDCLDILATLPDASVDAVVTDPPYGLEFMGKAWDGADGFRRSMNPADADRDNPFGRASRTSPEYRTDSKAQAGMSRTGYTDGAERLERPSHMGGLNPKCRVCQKWQRGGNPCTCEAPDFPNERLPRLHTFQAWCELWATECLRVLKPGGHILAFGGTRTSHRLACAIEDAGFEIRDSIAWLYGQGFPKSRDVSKDIDAMAGAEREVLRPRLYEMTDGGGYSGGLNTSKPRGESAEITAPASDAARTWQGWGTALKPAHEPVVVARKPLVGTVAANVLAHGTGGLNVDGCRVGTEPLTAHGGGPAGGHRIYNGDRKNGQGIPPQAAGSNPRAGRWPANVVLDESQAARLDMQSGETDGKGGTIAGWQDEYVGGEYTPVAKTAYVDRGGASRFFYTVTAACESCGRSTEYCRQSPRGCCRDCRQTPHEAPRFFYTAKADAAERVRLPAAGGTSPNAANRRCAICKRSEITGTRCECAEPQWERETPGHISHPTVKPLALMRWLVRLVTPPGGLVLEPFAGSGATVEACILEGFRCVAIEREADYLPLITQRIHRRRDPVAAVLATAEDGGLFDLLDDGQGA